MLYEFMCLSGNLGSDIAITLLKFKNVGDFIHVKLTLAFFYQHK
jgi:hypothetical protein